SVVMLLTFFEKYGDTYFRSDEFITETAYTPEEIETAIVKSGLELLDVFDADKDLGTPDMLSPVTETTERVFYITRKP
ncbi:MAG: hypothetical protein K2I93_03895, partial [Oscillospiraceae bacterium]|nr:hypothetical protein [Oscillospiraceae bacterium]